MVYAISHKVTGHEEWRNENNAPSRYIQVTGQMNFKLKSSSFGVSVHRFLLLWQLLLFQFIIVTKAFRLYTQRYQYMEYIFYSIESQLFEMSRHVFV